MEPMPSLDPTTPFTKNMATCSWATSGLPDNRQLMSSLENYQLYRCPLEFDETDIGGSFTDLDQDEEVTMLALGPFTWLLNICSGYHLFRREMKCRIEPYTPSRLARQFRYN